MKKSIALVLVVLMFAMFVACSQDTSDKPGDSEKEQVNTPEDTNTPEIQTAAHIETKQQGESSIEYVEVTGLPDIEVQNKLNEELEVFFAWVTVDAENPDKKVDVTAKYSIIGNRFISVRAYDLEYVEGAAYPVNYLRSNTYDLQTGEYAGPLSAFVQVEGLMELIMAGKFANIEPGVELPEMADKLYDNVNDSINFYLTETALGLSIEGENHASGDYWSFEASYEDLQSVLEQKLIDAIAVG